MTDKKVLETLLESCYDGIMKRNYILVLFAAFALTGCFNYTGANKQQAEKNAKEWANEMGFEGAKIKCNKMDTDGDGYVSCSMNHNGELTQVECAGESLIVRNEGCRLPKPNLRVNNYNSRE
jgi:hypothetical protein